MFISIDPDRPIYRQIYESLRSLILSGRLKAGERLSSTRALAIKLGVSRNSVLLAYDQLFAEGYLTGKTGAGTFISSVLPDASVQRMRQPAARSRAQQSVHVSAYAARLIKKDPLPPPGVRWWRGDLRYDFQYGLPAIRDFPHRIWQRLMARHLRKSELISLGYGPPEGYEPLRTAVAEYVQRARGVECEPQQVMIVNGSQQALDLTARVLLNPNDPFAIEEPHYQGARQVFESAGAKIIPIPVDADGLNVTQLRKRVKQAKLIYVTPSHQFPTGAIMPVARRLELLAWARDVDAYVIEDDYDGEYRYEGRPMAAVQGLDDSGRVIYIGTFSKSLFPSLRLGYAIVPHGFIQPFAAAKFLIDRQAPTLEQQVLADFITQGHYERHLRRSRTRNASRRSVLLESLKTFLGNRVEISGANAGVHLLIWLNNFPSARLPSLIQRAGENGIGIYPVTPYYISEPPRAALLLGYVSMNEEEIRSGIRLLARVLKA